MDSENRPQLELVPPPGEPHVEAVTEEFIKGIRRRKNFLAAWNWAQDFAGLEHKECYGPLGIDSSHWTKIRNGSGSPPAKSFNVYLDIVQNEIPLIWWAESRGYDWLTIRKHRSSEQRRISELEHDVAEKDRLIRHYERLLTGKGT